MSSPDVDREDLQAAKARESTEREFVRLWRVWRTVHQLVQDRGYELSDEEVNLPLDEFRSQYRGEDGEPDRTKMKFSARPSPAMMARYAVPPTATNPNPPGEIGTIWVDFLADTSIGIRHLRAFVNHLSEHHFYTGILVTNVPITPAALKIIPAVASETKVEYFVEHELLVNITHHELVPKHVLLSREEKSKLLQRYRLKETQLPRIHQTDSVAKYLGLRKGQVVKIIRISETAGRYASYRLCV